MNYLVGAYTFNIHGSQFPLHRLILYYKKHMPWVTLHLKPLIVTQQSFGDVNKHTYNMLSCGIGYSHLKPARIGSSIQLSHWLTRNTGSNFFFHPSISVITLHSSSWCFYPKRQVRNNVSSGSNQQLPKTFYVLSLSHFHIITWQIHKELRKLQIFFWVETEAETY